MCVCARARVCVHVSVHVDGVCGDEVSRAWLFRHTRSRLPLWRSRCSHPPALLRLFVKSEEVNNGRCFGLEVRKLVLQVRNKHAKLSPPVTDVVDAVHFVPHKLKKTADRLSDDGRSQVAHVHDLR